MHLGYNPDAFLEKSDLVIVLECDVPWIPSKKAPPPDAKIIQSASIRCSRPIRCAASPCDLGITGVLSGTLADAAPKR